MIAKLKPIAGLLGRGLVLDVRAYDEASEADNPFVEGIFMVAMVGLIVGVAELIGSVLQWAITPNLVQIQAILFDFLRSLPWFDATTELPATIQAIESSYNASWQMVQSLMQPLSRVPGLILIPVGLTISWLWFAVIAQGVAKLLGGEGKMDEMLGATALAVAPMLLRVFGFIPTVAIAGVGLWILLARYIAVRRVHTNLTWGRALIVTLTPSALIVLAVAGVGLIASLAITTLIGMVAS